MISAQFLRKYFLPSTPNVSRLSALDVEALWQSFSVEQYRRILRTTDQQTLQKLAQQKALRMFHKAAVEVPAYKDFLKRHRIQPQAVKTPKDLRSVPPVNKDNYLLRYPKQSLFWGGTQRGTTMFSISSGSTGKPYYWPRSMFLEYDTALTHELFADTFFNLRNTRTLVIDAYSMGMYVAGTFTLNSFRNLAKKGYPVTVVSPGIDIREVLQIVKDLGPDYDQLVIAGYPPFVKDILDQGIKDGIQWKRLNVKFIFGAENFSEEWRSHILGLVGIKIGHSLLTSSMNTYGSADCAVLGHETPLSIAIRRAAHKRHRSRAVFGTNYPPTVVQYNPLQRYFEKVDDHLVFTANGGIPLIRYDIKDEGQLLTFDELKSRVGTVDASPATVRQWRSLPFLLLAGRSGNTVTLYGLNIYPESIKLALEDKRIIRLVSGKFKLETKNDRRHNQYIELILELAGTTSKIPKVTQQTIQSTIVARLRQLNFEYAKLYEKLGNRAEPKITFVLRGTFQQITSKHRWTTR